MGKFLSRLILEAGPVDGGEWQLMAPLVYQSDIYKPVIVVPEGFETDLASVPRLPVVYMLTGGTSNEAAVVHDYLYSTGLTDRKTADAILREASAATGVPAWRRGLMWAGVRLFGGSHYTPATVSQSPAS
jgi:hypothetical protein